MKKLLILTAFILLPLQASAASLGDILRASFSMPYLMGSEDRRAFPDEMTVDSWGSPEVSEVDVSVLSARSLSGVVPLRRGSHLIKFGEDPKVYAIGPNGTLHWLINEHIASTLYGPHWNRNVVSLFESFLPNYSIGATLNTVSHPEGTIYKHASYPAVYYLQNGMARPFSGEQAFHDNHFSFRSVITVPDSVQYPAGQAITGYEEQLHPLSF